MKNVKFNTVLGLMTAIILLVFSACDKEQNLLSEPTIDLEATDLIQFSTDIADVQVENGILVFQNVEDYRSTLLGLNQSSELEQLLWEDGIGFHSMQRLFNDLMAAEGKKGTAIHSEKYLEALQSKVILEFKTIHN